MRPRGSGAVISKTGALAALGTLAIALSIPVQATTSTSVAIFSPWASSGLRHGFMVAGNVRGSCAPESV
jgi:hypothetical protein